MPEGHLKRFVSCKCIELRECLIVLHMAVDRLSCVSWGRCLQASDFPGFETRKGAIGRVP